MTIALKNISSDGTLDLSELDETRICPHDVFNVENHFEKLILPKKLEEIEEGTFRHCRKMKEVIFPDTLKKIGTNAFSETNIERIEVPNSVEYIGHGAFNYCRYLEKAVLPNNLESIDGMFDNCMRLNDVVLPKELKHIGPSSFEGCVALKSIAIPPQVTEIASDAFRLCVNLEEIRLPDALKTIGNGAFADCRALKEVEIPASVNKIGSVAFSDCISLEMAIIGDTTVFMSDTFNNCGKFKNIQALGINYGVDDLYDIMAGRRIFVVRDGYAAKNEMIFGYGRILPMKITLQTMQNDALHHIYWASQQNSDDSRSAFAYVGKTMKEVKEMVTA